MSPFSVLTWYSWTNRVLIGLLCIRGVIYTSTFVGEYFWSQTQIFINQALVALRSFYASVTPASSPLTRARMPMPWKPRGLWLTAPGIACGTLMESEFVQVSWCSLESQGKKNGVKELLIGRKGRTGITSSVVHCATIRFMGPRVWGQAWVLLQN